MYNLIGVDGRTYGPVSAAQIRHWIGEGRVHAQSRAQAHGAAEWKTLDAFPEFAEALAAKASPPLGPPAHAAGTALADEILARDYTVRIGNCFRRAWALYTSDLWTFLGASTVIWLLVWVSHGSLAGIVLTGPLIAGLAWYCLKRIRNQPARFEQIFSGFTLDFLHTMLAGTLTTVLVLIGLALCIIPGIYLKVAWMFALPLVIDQRLEFWDAMEVSRKVVNRHWWSLFGLLLLLILINLCGMLALLIGVFFTFPLTTLAWLYAYEDIFGAHARPA